MIPSKFTVSPKDEARPAPKGFGVRETELGSLGVTFKGFSIMKAFRVIEIITLVVMAYIPFDLANAGAYPVAPALASLVLDNPVCFSPEEGCDLKLVKFYQLAEKQIDVAVYDINRKNLVDLLIKRAKNVKIRVICDERQSKGPKSLVHSLVEAGIKVKFGRQHGIMHDKFSIADDYALETGSFNYTNHASEANQENQLYTVDAKVVSRYVQRFELMWDNAKPFKKK